jgi:NADH-quinone oxidoreductase subunit F
MFTEDELDVPMDYESVAAAGSILGTKAMQIFDETTSVVRTTLRWVEFYKHESCGKCTPCREGSWWLVQLLHNIEEGKGEEGDIEKILDICDNVSGKSFCTLADGFVGCVKSAIGKFREEFEAGYHTPAWELFPYGRSALFNAPAPVNPGTRAFVSTGRTGATAKRGVVE